MKIRKILEGDVIPMIPRRPQPQEKMPRFRTLCPDCGKPMRGGTDTRTGQRVHICMNCYKTVEEEETEGRLIARRVLAKRQAVHDEHFGHGYDDFRRGVHRDDNPHKAGLARKAWFAGWDERAGEKAL